MPIWDEFLTERDKKHLETSGRDARGHKTFGLRPALLIIDDYYSVLGTTPQPILESVKTWPMSCGMEGWEAVYKTQELLDSARSADIPIVFATGLGDFPSPWGMRDQGPGRLTAEQKEIAFKIVEELAPRPSELVIKKAAASAFWGTPLVGHLVAKGVDTVIACGETTSGCVRASVVDGSMFRFRMGVVAECTFDRTEASHAINLFDMNQKYAKVIPLSEAIRYFDGIAEDKPPTLSA
jgi:nicotinamidase-related amidase